MSEVKVILVDESDQEIGTMEKLEAHEKGLLHRAFSIFLFNEKGQMLLQQRALSKYHTPGLWTNTCCSHPAPGETIKQAAKRRLQQEMGISGVNLEVIFDFIYYKEFDNGLIEHELDHVLIGEFEGDAQLNPVEAEDAQWLYPKEIKEWIELAPEKFTYWFKLAFSKLSFKAVI
jgi:isopentenyl-diphosphate delta-isomerase